MSETNRPVSSTAPAAGAIGKSPVMRNSFLEDSWYVAGWSSEFAGDDPIARTIIDKPLAIYRTTSGELVAIDDRCAHRWAPLSQGRVEGDDIRCMYHGLKFGPDGKCVEVPGQTKIAPSLCVRSYPVLEKYKFVWIWMGDRGNADETLIPDLSMLDQEWRRTYTGSLDYDANHSLISDNLLDFSHLSFLHAKTLGKPVERTDECTVKPVIRGGSEAKALPRGVRVEGWVSGPSARIAVLPKNVPDGDLWSRVDFLVPGILISHAQMYPEGTADRYDDLAPDGEVSPLSDAMSIQAVTPLTQRTTRYFYSLGPRDSDMDSEEADQIWALTLAAFSEDVAMIEAQQRVIDRYPGDHMGGIAADRGVVLFRKLMSRLIEADSKSSNPRPSAKCSPLVEKTS